MGSISLGMVFVAGRKRVPSPATGITALRTFIGSRCHRWERADKAHPWRRGPTSLRGGTTGDGLAPTPTRAGATRDPSRVEALAVGQIHPAPMSPVAEDDRFGPMPEVEPGLTVHGA